MTTPICDDCTVKYERPIKMYVNSVHDRWCCGECGLVEEGGERHCLDCGELIEDLERYDEPDIILLCPECTAYDARQEELDVKAADLRCELNVLLRELKAGGQSPDEILIAMILWAWRAGRE